MVKPLLLLDVDGVLVRDRPLLDHVRYNVNAYVAKKLPNVKNPGRVNQILYSQYGHTGRGLFYRKSVRPGAHVSPLGGSFWD